MPTSQLPTVIEKNKRTTMICERTAKLNSGGSVPTSQLPTECFFMTSTITSSKVAFSALLGQDRTDLLKQLASGSLSYKWLRSMPNFQIGAHTFFES